MGIRNFIFSLLICLFIAGPIGFVAIKHTDLFSNLPYWLTSEQAKYLSGNQENTNLYNYLKIQCFETKEFQNAVDTYLDNSIPMKANALLFNAAIQRNAIKASNTIFNFPAYPTSFEEKKYCFLEKEGALSDSGYTIKDLNEKGITKFCKSLGHFSRDHKNMKIVVMLVNDTRMQSTNPVIQLSSNALDPKKLAETFNSALDKYAADSVFLSTEIYSSMEEYYRYFFKSDHHWSARGANVYANKILKALGKPQSDYDVSIVDGPFYSGAYSRFSLCPVEDEPIDINADFEDLETIIGEYHADGNQHSAYETAPYLSKHYEFYDLFYQRFTETKGPGKGRILLVSDSFGYALIRPLAQQSESLFSVSDLHSQDHNSKKLSMQLEKTGADTVIFVGHLSNFSTFDERQPGYFS